MKCLNIIVFYDNRSEVENYINEVEKFKKELIDIIIVVNSDKKNQVSKMLEEFHSMKYENIKCINYDENVGYLNAMLKTIKQINIMQYKYIILSNTDIHYKQDDFIEYLLKQNYEDKIGCIAPSVYASKTKTYSNPHYIKRITKTKLERLVRIFSKEYISYVYFKLAFIKACISKKEEESSCYVYSPHGCYMIFTLDFVQQMLGLEYEPIMYSEESYIGELLRKYNKKCFFDSNIKVEHHESTVTGKLEIKKKISYMKNSIEYILKEFY